MLQRQFWLNVVLTLTLIFDNSLGQYDYEDYPDYEIKDYSALAIKDDYAKKKCSDFESDGFNCVPFYGCLAGEIITNGATILNFRGLGKGRKKRGIDLGPLDARCFCGVEICCRHPDYKDVPLEINPGTLKDASNDEKCITTTTTTTITTTTTTTTTTTIITAITTTTIIWKIIIMISLTTIILIFSERLK